MSLVSRQIVKDILFKRQALTAEDMLKQENLGEDTNKYHLNYILKQLVISGHVLSLKNAVPVSYILTQKGIDESL